MISLQLYTIFYRVFIKVLNTFYYKKHFQVSNYSANFLQTVHQTNTDAHVIYQPTWEVCKIEQTDLFLMKVLQISRSLYENVMPLLLKRSGRFAKCRLGHKIQLKRTERGEFQCVECKWNNNKKKLLKVKWSILEKTIQMKIKMMIKIYGIETAGIKGGLKQRLGHHLRGNNINSCSHMATDY